MKPFFSIIIPFKNVDKYLLECVEWCLKQEYKKFEIILLPDNKLGKFPLNDKKGNIKVLPTGEVYPSRKRNIGIKKSKGNFCAFIDSDAFPMKDWLKNSIRYFKNEEIAAVGGPNIPPERDPFLNRITGKIISNFFATGSVAKRFKVLKKNYYADELSASNLIVRKKVLEEIGGFDEDYLTGEDCRLCFLINRMGKRILYARDVQVHHHQRAWLLPYLKQVWIWGSYRGNLIYRYNINPKIEHFIPFFFILFVFVGGILSLFFKPFFLFYFSVMILYILTSLIFSLREGITTFPLVFISIPLTHLAYATGFLLGMMGF